jgi:Flp pilus assembly pilin Flp
MKLLTSLWTDECGALLSSEYILLASLLTVGLIVGMTAARNSLVTELEDYAEAIGSLNLTNLPPGVGSGGISGTSNVAFDGTESGTYTVVP